MNISRHGMQRPRSRQHNVRPPLRRTCPRDNRCAADSAAVQEEYRPEVETDDVSMVIEVCQNHLHAEMQCEARRGESKVNFDKSRLSQAEADHEVQ